LETIQDESIISPDKGSIDNNNNDKVRHNEDLEHKRQSFLEILKQRKIFIDSETGKLINDHANIQTLFHIIEKEREKDMMKAKALPEAFLNPDKLAVMKMLQQYYAIPYNVWYRGYCSTRSNVRANHDMVTVISDKSTYGMVFSSICIWLHPIGDFGRNMLQEILILHYLYPLFV
jgi:hypothetical protein